MSKKEPVLVNPTQKVVTPRYKIYITIIVNFKNLESFQLESS